MVSKIMGEICTSALPLDCVARQRAEGGSSEEADEGGAKGRGDEFEKWRGWAEERERGGVGGRHWPAGGAWRAVRGLGDCVMMRKAEWERFVS